MALESEVTPEVKEVVTPEVKDEVKEEKQELTAEEQAEITNALSLFRGLKDPDKGIDVVKFLAEQAGLKISAETSVKQATKTIADELKEELGDEYAFLADKLGKGLEKVVGRLIEDKTKDIRSAHAQTEKEILETKFDAAWAELDLETEGELKKYEEAIGELTAEYPWNKKTTFKKYLSDLLSIATSNASSSKKTEKMIDKIRKGSERANLSGGVGAGEEVKLGSKLPSLDEAIAHAVQGKKLS